jgi:hypothetical protein
MRHKLQHSEVEHKEYGPSVEETDHENHFSQPRGQYDANYAQSFGMFTSHHTHTHNISICISAFPSLLSLLLNILLTLGEFEGNPLVLSKSSSGGTANSMKVPQSQSEQQKQKESESAAIQKAQQQSKSEKDKQKEAAASTKRPPSSSFFQVCYASYSAFLNATNLFSRSVRDSFEVRSH